MKKKQNGRGQQPVTVEELTPQQRPVTEATSSNHIRNWRFFRGIKTHQELVDLTIKADKNKKGINRISLSRLENGEMRYNQDQIELLARALNVSPGDLISTDPFNSGDIFLIYAGLSAADKRKLQNVAVDMFGRPKGRDKA